MKSTLKALIVTVRVEASIAVIHPWTLAKGAERNSLSNSRSAELRCDTEIMVPFFKRTVRGRRESVLPVAHITSWPTYFSEVLGAKICDSIAFQRSASGRSPSSLQAMAEIKTEKASASELEFMAQQFYEQPVRQANLVPFARRAPTFPFTSLSPHPAASPSSRGALLPGR